MPAIPMLPIPTGRITLRDDRLKQSWEVEIAPFLLGKFPVTQDVYTEVMGVNPSHFIGEKRPVENVSWLEAVQFCNRLSIKNNLAPCYTIHGEQVSTNATANGYRLPTEAEWQYACQAGTTQPRYGAVNDIAWYKQNSKGQTQDVGLLAPNAWGMHDMLGNVWEWCADVYDAEVYGAYRILRGGGWSDEERGCLATNRRRSHPTFRIDDLGFRVAQLAL